MCGIAGFVTANSREYSASKFISDSFIAGSLRGVHSSGIAVIDTEKELYESHKLPINGTFFVEDTVAKRLITASQSSNHITITHTRHATVGAIGYATAHPFEINDQGRSFVGVHNGTLTNWSSKKNANYYSVDSEWALNHIFDNGDEAFKDFTGAFVFAWWDSVDPDILNIALNNQRPMHVAFIEGGGMAYASEAGMLYWLMERNNLKLDGKIRMLTAGNHYKFNVKDLKAFTKKVFPKPTYTSSYTSSTSSRSYTSTGSYRPVVDKVQDLIDRVSGKSSSKEDTPAKSTPSVTRDEYENAKNLSVHMTEGEFIPKVFVYSSGELRGKFTAAGMEWEAVARNCHNLSWQADHRYRLKVLGIQDDGDELVAVLMRPNATNLMAEGEEVACEC